MKKQNRNIADGSDAESESEEWSGIGDAVEPVAEVMPDDEEYVDEDKYTTVTVEPMDGEKASEDKEDDPEESAEAVEVIKDDGNTEVVPKKRIWKKDGQSKAKKRKFRYESKAERQATRQKQKSKNHKAKLRRTGK